MKPGMKNLIKKTIFSCLWLVFLSVFMGMYSSCSDDGIEIKNDEDKLFTLSDQKLSVSSKAQYRSLQIVQAVENLKIVIESDSEWIRLPEDTIGSDGWFDIYIDEDKEGMERSGQLTVTASDGMDSHTEICEIRQSEDKGTNDYEEPASKSMRVGYGYDIFGKYMNDLSVKEPILSQSLLSQYTDVSGLVETSSRSVLDIEKNTSRGLVEMAQMLTKKEEKTESGITGNSRTVNEISSSSYDGTSSQYAYIRFYKTAAMRSIDLGMLKMMLDQGKQLFSDDFAEIRAQIIKDPSNEANINDMLDKFGTHLVVQGELGAAIEVTARFDKNLTGGLDMRAEDFADYFFKGETSSFILSTGQIKDLQTQVKVGVNCHIYGGSATTKETLKEDINNNGRVKEDILLDWLNSSSGNASDNEIAQALVPINFQLIPVWELFPKECLNPIFNAVKKIAERSTNKVADSVTGIDYYQIELTPELLSFKDDADATLVKVLYASNTQSGTLSPVLEICNEYVPVIRGDKRITVIYGIKDGRTFHGAGFFPGDGEGNPPAWLTFSEGDVYVKPVKGAGAFEKMNKLYYLHGNIYETNLGIDTPVPSKQKTEEQYFKFKYPTASFPIVKIGSGYWTRKNINESMEFGEPYSDEPDCDYYIYEELIDGTIYANVFWGNSHWFRNHNPGLFDADEDPQTGQRIYWYLPRVNDIRNMKTYIGDNCKALFKEQQSGFDADFVGYYGIYDDLNNGSHLGKYGVYYKGELCFVAAKENEKTGEALVLAPDYTFDKVPINKATDNYYPVRPYRTSYYQYQ